MNRSSSVYYYLSSLDSVLLFQLLLVRYATQSLAEIRANCNEDVTLDCPGLPSGDMNFLSLTWYKVSKLFQFFFLKT